MYRKSILSVNTINTISIVNQERQETSLIKSFDTILNFKKLMKKLRIEILEKITVLIN